MTAFSRLSLNQKTVQRWSLHETLEGCARHDIPFVGLWRDSIAEFGLSKTVQLLHELDLRVSSLCRGGFFPAGDPSEFKANLDDNRRAILEAAELGSTRIMTVSFDQT